jgi:chemotaxis protein MotB
MIEGHTDDQPIARSGWKSNWELGSARALAILHFMARMNFDPSKLSAATYGQYRELAANDSPAQRALNRRAVITVKTESAPAPAPAPVAPAPGAAIVAPIDMSDPAP